MPLEILEAGAGRAPSPQFRRETELALAASAAWYPGFAAWLARVFREAACGRRTILLAVMDGRTAGAAVLKHAPDEEKLCSLCAAPEFRRRGIGTALLREGLRRFAGDPLVTMPQEALPAFRRIIERWRFVPLKTEADLYGEGRTEHFFRIPNPFKVQTPAEDEAASDAALRRDAAGGA